LISAEHVGGEREEGGKERRAARDRGEGIGGKKRKNVESNEKKERGKGGGTRKRYLERAWGRRARFVLSQYWKERGEEGTRAQGSGRGGRRKGGPFSFGRTLKDGLKKKVREPDRGSHKILEGGGDQFQGGEWQRAKGVRRGVFRE